MRMCQHCGAGIPNYAGFCGECGQLVSIGQPATQGRTVWTSPPTTSAQEPTTIITASGDRRDETDYSIEDAQTHEQPIANTVEEDEEEKRRRYALLGFGLPLIGGAIEGQGQANVPMVQSTPQISGAPTVTGTPPIGHAMPPTGTPPISYGMPPIAGVTTTPLVLSAPPGGFAYPPPSSLPNTGQPPLGSNKPQPNQPSGCMVWLIVVIVVPLIILISLIGAAFTFLAPTLALSGSADVAAGDLLHLNGGHFIPGNSVTCVLDGSIVLSHASLPYPISGAHTMTNALLLAQQSNATTLTQTQETGTTIIVGSDGTFSVTFVVGPDWKIGQHTIRATEAFSPRSATTTFNVSGNGQTPDTPTSTPTVTVTTTPTSTSTVTPTTTATKPGLSAITPNVISFGPFSEGSTQTTSTQVLLNTAGTGLLNWTATWDTAQAGWLQLNALSGQIQEPGTQTLIVSATVGALKAGTYNATILFSSDGQNGQKLSLPVSLTVQAGCVKASPNTLNFVGTIGANNPAAQTVTLNNCGAAGNWTAATTGSSWLIVSPTGGNLNTGATQNILVSTLLANLKSGPGTYQGQITFTNGPAHAVVNVVLTVQPAPLPGLATNITSFSINQQCTFSGRMWRCTLITLSRTGNATSNLNWTATSNSTVKITINPTSGTLQVGQTAAIEIDTPRLACDASVTIGTITFTGPANSITVTMSC